MANVVIEVIAWCHVEYRRTVRVFFSRNKRQFRIFSVIHQCRTILFCAICIFLIESVSFQRFNHAVLHIRNGYLINRRFRIRHIQTHRCIVSKACFYIYDISNITIMEEQGKVVFVYCRIVSVHIYRQGQRRTVCTQKHEHRLQYRRFTTVVVTEEHIHPRHTIHFGIAYSAVISYCYVLYIVHSILFLLLPPALTQ